MKTLLRRLPTIGLGLLTVLTWILETVREDKLIKEEVREAVHDELFPEEKERNRKEGP